MEPITAADTCVRESPPWTIHRTEPDYARLRPAAECPQITYPKPDGVLTFDRLSSVFISNTNHNEHQPAHLTLKDASVPVAINLAKYAGQTLPPDKQFTNSGGRKMGFLTPAWREFRPGGRSGLHAWPGPGSRHGPGCPRSRSPRAAAAR